MLRSLLNRVFGNQPTKSRRRATGSYCRALRAEALEERRMLSANVIWTRQLGTDGSDVSNAVSADGVGNVYISGYTSGDLYGTTAGNRDVFVSKYADDGSPIWTRQLGTSGEDSSHAVSADGLGNVYISGSTTSSLGGAFQGGLYDAFVSKYDSDGNRAWTRQLGSTGHEVSYGVSADGLGNVYISGWTTGDLYETNAGGSDAFVSKYNADGEFLWTRQFGTSEDDGAYAVSADGLGNVYISGRTEGNLGGGSDADGDAFVSKYDASGNFLWTRQLGSDEFEISNGVSADGLGNVYISGYTRGDLDGTNAGGDDAFVSKYDADGTFLWTRQLGTASEDLSKAVSADEFGNVYISGSTQGDLDGTNAGYSDAFVNKYDANGTLMRTKQLGTTPGDYSYGVSADNLGNVYISGQTAGDLGGTNAGLVDAFVVRINDFFVVNTTSDTVDADVGDGVAEDASGNTSLRAAIQEANASGEPTIIYVPEDEDAYELDHTGTEANDASYNDLDISGDITIIGDGAGLTVIDAGGQYGLADRVFDVIGGGSLDLSRATITGGYLTGDGGAGIRVNDDAELILTDCSVVQNVNTGGAGGGVFRFQDGNATIRRSVFVGNSTSSRGGAICSSGNVNYSGVLTIGESVFAQNTATIAGPNVFIYADTDYTNLGYNLVDDATGDRGFFDDVNLHDHIGSVNYVVTSVADAVDDTLDGTAADASGFTTLRAAVQEANYASDKTIWLPAWQDRLTLTGADNAAATGDLDITGEVTIVGVGAGLTVIDAGGQYGLADRVFDVIGGGSLDLSRATITGGYLTGDGGAGIRVNDDAELILTDCSVVQNVNTGGAGGGVFRFQDGNATIRRSVFVGNSTSSRGGAICSSGNVNYSGVLTIGESVFAQNTATIAGPNVFIYADTDYTNLGYNLVDDATGDRGFFDDVNLHDHIGSVDYVVTSVADTANDTPDIRYLSLREAVGLANDTAGDETIWMPLWMFILTEDKGTASTDTNVSVGDLNIFDTLSVRGIDTGTEETTIAWRSDVTDEVFRLMGDYFEDYTVDGADHFLWDNSAPAADGDEDGDVDIDDYDIWFAAQGNEFELINVDDGTA